MSANNPRPWSKPAAWTMGILKDADWRAEWISARKRCGEPALCRIHIMGAAAGFFASAPPPIYPTMLLRRVSR